MSKAVLHAEHVRQAMKARNDVCAPLALSWQRCVTLHRLDPEIAPPMNRLSEPELRDTIAPTERLLAIAAPSLEQLHRSIVAS